MIDCYPNNFFNILIMVIVFIIAPFIILGIVIRWYGYLAPPVKGLPVLMYHKVDMNRKDNLTVSIEQFESHLKFLKENKYEPISMNQLIHFLEKKSLLPDKPINPSTFPMVLRSKT